MAADALSYIQASVTRASAAATNGSTFTMKGGTPRRGMVVCFRVTAISGTTPTITFKIQDTRNSGTNWLDRTLCVGSSLTTDAISAVGEYFITLHTDADYIRIVDTVAGTSPSVTWEAFVVPGYP